jgi:hypothetical protein
MLHLPKKRWASKRNIELICNHPLVNEKSQRTSVKNFQKYFAKVMQSGLNICNTCEALSFQHLVCVNQIEYGAHDLCLLYYVPHAASILDFKFPFDVSFYTYNVCLGHTFALYIILNCVLFITSAICNKAFNTHAKCVRAERTKFYKHMMKAENDPAIYMCMVVDGVSYSKNVRSSGGMETLEVHMSAALFAGIPPRIEFSFTRRTGEDPEAFRLYLHRNILFALEMNARNVAVNGKHSEVVYLELYDCSHAIITKETLSIMALRYGFRKIKANFMPVGHSMENVNHLFSRFDIAISRQNIYKMDVLMNVVKMSYTPMPICEFIQI